MLGHYLLESNRRQTRSSKNARLIMIIDLFSESGSSSLGNVMAYHLRKHTREATAYTEYPTPEQIIGDFYLDSKNPVFHHPNGYDILVTSEDNHLPMGAKMTLLVDKMLSNYKNIVITVNTRIDENVAMMLDYTQQVIIVTPPTPDAEKQVNYIKRELKKYIRPNETTVFTLLNRSKKEYAETDAPDVDFEIPFLSDFPKRTDMKEKDIAVPQAFQDTIMALIDRLERTQQIGIYIPSTIDVDHAVDTSEYVDRTLAFLGERFGGATSTQQAQGVWNSQEVGLVDETVHIVTTYVTQDDLNKYLDEVIDFIKQLKDEMRQEAMALEVNKKLTLL
jgi:hypothetical protein